MQPGQQHRRRLRTQRRELGGIGDSHPPHPQPAWTDLGDLRQHRLRACEVLAADPAAPAAAAVAQGVLLTAKWMVNLAGPLWVAATVAAALGTALPVGLRRAGVVAAVSGLAAVVLPWTTGTAGLSATAEQLGYALHLPVMLWWGALGWRWGRSATRGAGRPARTAVAGGADAATRSTTTSTPPTSPPE
jgi:hypothetical protein